MAKPWERGTQQQITPTPEPSVQPQIGRTPPTTSFGGGKPWERGTPQSGVTATGTILGGKYQKAGEDVDFENMTNRALIEQQLGASVNSQAELGDYLLRADLARSELPAEKVGKLKQAGYEAQAVSLPQGETTFFRKPGENAFSRIDTPNVTTQDVADLLGSLGNVENLAGTAGAVIAPQRLPLQMAATGVGTYLGNLADQAIETFRGFQETPPEQQQTQALTSAGLAAGGEVAGSVLNKMRGALTGETGIMTPKPEVAEAQKIARENPELMPPTAGQSSQFFQRAENRIAQTGEKVSTYRQKQKQTLKESMQKLVAGADTDLSSLDDETLMLLNNELEKDILKRFDMSKTAAGGQNIEKGGEALVKARAAYQKAQDEYFRRQYPELWRNRPEGVFFDLSPVKEKAQQILAGREVPLESGETGTLAPPISPKMRGVLEQLAGGENTPGFADVVDDPEILKEVATLFRDFAEPDPMTGKRSVEGGLAQDIISAINQQRYNPKGVDEASDFGQQWKQLSGQYAKYIDTLDLPAMRELNTTDNPYGALVKTIQPGDPARLRQMKEISSPEQWQQVQQGFQDYLASDPAKINSVLDGYKRDAGSLRLLMTPEQEKSYRVFGNFMERVGEGPTKKLLTQQGDIGARTLSILEKSTDEQFKEYLSGLQRLNPGKEQQTKKVMLKGLVETILEKHTKYSGGVPDFNLNGFANEMDKLIRTGRLKEIADPAQIQALKDRTLLASVYGKTARSDAGASLGGSADVQDVLTAPGTGSRGSRIGQIYQVLWDNTILANLMVNPKAQRVLFGSGQQPNLRAKNITRSFATALGLVGDDLAAASDLKFDMEEKPGAEKAKKILQPNSEMEKPQQ